MRVRWGLLRVLQRLSKLSGFDRGLLSLSVVEGGLGGVRLVRRLFILVAEWIHFTLFGIV